ncbi:hypothetical protein SteCoe_14125 [Stentor coeruleus]|uniref:Translin-associated factor X-interacting protein 1 N-terminal domain-containing protein n=1 Tax=Stentor coeruleus TaxID=5963 RepID=A0A1R2C6T1_9CILI|nr:hypothetical protein SteCoe_14125 [Stentor coeruleus]
MSSDIPTSSSLAKMASNKSPSKNDTTNQSFPHHHQKNRSIRNISNLSLLTIFSPYASKSNNQHKSLDKCSKNPKIILRKNIVKYPYSSSSLCVLKKISTSYDDQTSFTKYDKTSQKSSFDNTWGLLNDISSEKNYTGKIAIINKIFQKLIHENPGLEKTLKKIKDVYENALEEKNKIIISQQENIRKLENMKLELLNELESTIKDNKELIIKHNQINKNYTSIAARFNELTGLNLGQVAKNAEEYERVIKEHKKFKENLSLKEKELVFYKTQARKLTKVLSLIEKSGLSIEEICSSQIENFDSELLLELWVCDNHNLTSGRIHSTRPEIVPRLNLQNLDKKNLAQDSDTLSDRSENSIGEDTMIENKS